MNLVGTLAKVAIGAMLARGVGKMISGGDPTGGSETVSGAGGLGGLLGGALGGVVQPGQQGGGLGGLLGALGGDQQQGGGLGGLLGGALGSGQHQGGGLGGLLEGLAGGAAAQHGAGGLADMLGGVLSGGGQGAGAMGGLGGLLDNLGAGGASGGSGLGGLLNQALGGQSTPEPTPDQNSQAEIMLRGMINAAKSDGQIDGVEQQKILDHLGDVTQDEIDFVRSEMAAPLDVDAFVRSVPNGAAQQVYAMSLLGIQLDSQAEAQYLDRLARGLGISQNDVNSIHGQIGLPNLYA